MSYREDERQKAVKIRDELFKDSGSGVFLGKARDFVLKDPSLNLWAGIREDAKQYFKSNGISWWKGDAGGPTGHLLSSQIACLNHLYYVRQRQDIATALLQSLVPDIVKAQVVDTGFVEFEYIGKRRYMRERGFTRGAHCTSLDAVMIGSTLAGIRTMFLIEWKYTECYEREDQYVPARAKVYDSLITCPDGPFVASTVPQWVYYEPFYQMMRQTLLGWLFAKNQEQGCDRCINVHVIPKKNTGLKKTITSPHLSGRDIHDAWSHILKDPESYMPTDPEALFTAAGFLVDTKSWLSYLKTRYW